MSPLKPLGRSAKLDHVLYDIRGPVADEAARLAAEGHRVLQLNVGNPAIFGFETPDAIVQDIARHLRDAQGYTVSQGIPSARRAIVGRYDLVDGFPPLTINDVFLGNGVSELITMTLQALLDTDDEVLIPSPDYPLWTAMTALSGGTPVHYRCDEEDDWNPDLADIAAKITPRTKAIVVINPNNPTGAVYSREVLEGIVRLAREHSLLVLADEIYDRILYDDAEHVSIATLAPDLLVVTYNGLSKTYRAAGYRGGWMVMTGPKEHARGFLEGVRLLASTRLCPNALAQYGIQAALAGKQSITGLTGPGGRLRQSRDAAVEGLNAIPGVSCTTPRGALYAFPRLDPEVHEIHDDERFAFDLLRQEHIHLTQGTGFNWPAPDHFRIVTLPYPDDMREAVQRIGNFLASYRQ